MNQEMEIALAEIRDEIATLQRDMPDVPTAYPLPIPPPESVAATIRHFKIIRNSTDEVTDRSDLLPCHRFDPEDPDAEETDVVWVAKPWFLRGATTWDGMLRANIRYTYGQGDQTGRNAQREGVNGTPNGDPERQVIVPGWREGDIIRAAIVATGLSSTATEEGDEPTLDIVWEDDNQTGRMWMEVDQGI